MSTVIVRIRVSVEQLCEHKAKHASRYASCDRKQNHPKPSDGEAHAQDNPKTETGEQPDRRPAVLRPRSVADT